MNVALNQLLKGLDELKDYVEFNSLSNTAIYEIAKNNCYGNVYLQQLIKHTSLFKTKKALEYNSYIITLYGLLEKFIESVVKEYLDNLCNIATRFTDLPQTIQTHHLKLSLDLFALLDRGMYQHVKPTTLIQTLNAAHIDQKPNLIVESFQRHTSNFRSEFIADYFRQLGIHNINKKALLYNPFKDRVALAFSNPAGVELKRIFNILDDLIERRNDVAHGVGSFELLDKSIFIEYIDFIEDYSRSLLSVLIDECNKLRYQLSHSLSLVAVFNNTILCTEPIGLTVKVGDQIVMKKPEGNTPQYGISTIIGMEINNTDFNIIREDNCEKVALLLNETIKENFSFGLICRHKTN